jgi:hypothetical protein
LHVVLKDDKFNIKCIQSIKNINNLSNLKLQSQCQIDTCIKSIK